MAGFTIKTLTQKGVEALEQCMREEEAELKKMNVLDKMKFKRMWIRHTSKNPLTDCWTVHPNAIRFLRLDPSFLIKTVVKDVHIAMLINGALKDKDYVVTVSEIQ